MPIGEFQSHRVSHVHFNHSSNPVQSSVGGRQQFRNRLLHKHLAIADDILLLGPRRQADGILCTLFLRGVHV